MWRATNSDGTLTYSFVDVQAFPFWTGCFIGGVFIVVGMLLMAYNCYKTIRAGRRGLRERVQTAWGGRKWVALNTNLLKRT